MFHSSLSNLYNNVIIYNIKKSWEQFCLWTKLQNCLIHVIRALYIDVSLYLTLTIQASSRLKRSPNHLWNSSDICRKKFGECPHCGGFFVYWFLFIIFFYYSIFFFIFCSTVIIKLIIENNFPRIFSAARINKSFLFLYC